MNAPEPALDGDGRGVRGARGFLNGVPVQNPADGHEAPGDALAAFAGERGLKLVLAGA